MFPNPRVDKAVLTPSHQICTPCQNILKRLVFIMLFGIYSNFFIVLPIRFCAPLNILNIFLEYLEFYIVAY